jgi:hypothetical protein
MRYYDTLAEYNRAGFDIIVDKTWEDLPLEDLFDTSTDPDTGKPYYDVEQMARDIDSGKLDYFMLRVRAMYEDVELAVNYVGGFVYEDAAEVLRDGVAEDMIAETIEDAKKRVTQILQGLSKIPVDTETV